MTQVRPLKKQEDRAIQALIPDTDDVIIASLVNESGGSVTGSIYGAADSTTTTVNIGTGSAVTTLNIGAAGAETTINGNLTVNGTTTTINTQNLKVEDKLIALNVDALTEPADSMGLAMNRGSSGPDAVMIYATNSRDRFEFGFFETSDGTVAPSGLTSFGDLKINDLLLAGANVTSDGALTIETLSSSLLTIGSATTGDIDLGTDATARQIDIGNGTGSTSVNIDAGTGGFTADSTGTTANAIRMTVSGAGGGINIDANTTGTADIDGGTVNVGGTNATTVQIGNATGSSITNLDSGTGGLNIDSTGAISIDGAATSNVTVASADLTISTTTSGDLNLTAANDINFTALGGSTVRLNQSGAIDLSSEFSSAGIDSIIGALNGIVDGTIVLTTTLQEAYENGNTITTDSTNGVFSVTGTENIVLTSSTTGSTSVTGGSAGLNLASGNNAGTAAGAEIDITAASGGAATQSGGAIDINAGTGNTTGAGGAVSISSGDGGASGVGGAIDILAGTSNGSGNDGPDITIRAGASGSGSGDDGGFVIVQGGTGAPGDDGGDVEILGGDTTVSAARRFGNICIGETGAGVNTTNLIFIKTADATATYDPGGIQIRTGDTNTGGFNGSVISFKPGDGRTGSNSKGANLDLQPGNGDGSGDGGDFVLEGGVAGDTGTGGIIDIFGGTGGSTSGAGGDVRIQGGGQGTSTSDFGSLLLGNDTAGTNAGATTHQVEIRTANATATYEPGSIIIQAGETNDGLGSGFTGGALQLAAGSARPGAGGAGAGATLNSGDGDGGGAGGLIDITAGSSSSGTGGAVDISGGDGGTGTGGALTLNAGDGDTAEGAINIGSTYSSSIVIGKAATSTLMLDAVDIILTAIDDISFSGNSSATTTFNQLGDLELNSNFSSIGISSIIAALNGIQDGRVTLFATVSSANSIKNTYTAGEDIVAGEGVYISGANTVSLTDANSTTTIDFIGVAETSASMSATLSIITEGITNVRLIPGLTVGPGVGEVHPGAVVFLSLTAGQFTTDSSVFTSGDTAVEIGFIKDILSYDGATGNEEVELQIRVGAKTVVT